MNDEDRPLGARRAAAAVPPLAELRKAALGDGPLTDTVGANDVDPDHTFTIDYVDDRRKRRWTGNFKSHVLTVKENIEVGKMIAGLRGNIPPVALDDQTLQLTEIVGTLVIALEDCPEWAKGDKLLKMYDGGVAVAIYKEVRDHWARFWGADPETTDATDGAKPSAE